MKVAANSILNVCSYHVTQVFQSESTLYSFVFFKLGFTPCEAKQPLRGMELQERKHEKKITGYRKSV